MNNDSAIRNARTSVCIVVASLLCPHPEEARSAVSKDGHGSRRALRALLTLRAVLLRRLDPRFLDDLRPERDFRLDHLREFRSRAADHIEPVILEPLAHV